MSKCNFYFVSKDKTDVNVEIIDVIYDDDTIRIYKNIRITMYQHKYRQDTIS